MKYYCIRRNSKSVKVLAFSTLQEAKAFFAGFLSTMNGNILRSHYSLWRCDVIYSDTGEIRSVNPTTKV